ncbi:MAG TPA: alpha/beta fold hydrolase [Terriglobales bacterium]|nr:alpha/beta fold hydrolase [Terriglobales bacterium]
MSADSNVREIANFRSETAVVNGVRLHYWIGGDPNGISALLWHGFLGTGYSWHKVMPLLAEAGFSILVPDMRGYGDSEKPAGDEGYDSRALAYEFRALVRQIEFGGGQPLLLAAHDMGAPPALLWAADYPGGGCRAPLHGSAGHAGGGAHKDHDLHPRGNEKGLDVVVDSPART